MPTKVSTIEIDMSELDGILRRVDANELTEGDCEAIRTLCKAYVQLTELSKEDADGTSKDKPNRRGLFTSGIVSTREGRKIALFFSGRQHAGENLNDLLSHRAKALDAPIQMCDALSRNLPADLETIVAHCLAHRRRQFVEVAEQFPEECRYVLESLAVIYRNDAMACQRNLSPSARRHFHQAESGPTMEKLHIWLGRQLEDRLTLVKLRSSVRSRLNPLRCSKPVLVTSVPLRLSSWSCRNPLRCSKPAAVILVMRRLSARSRVNRLRCFRPASVTSV
jgi:hypothetical protein